MAGHAFCKTAYNTHTNYMHLCKIHLGIQLIYNFFLETIPWKTLPWPSLFGALLLSLGMILWYIQYTLYVVHLK